MPINLPREIAYDIRQPILGDSYGWCGLEPAAAKTSIVIHGTGSDAPLEDGFTMADYHVNHNGWGGVGVHFVVTEDSYPGKPAFGLPAGVQVQYVGDLLTWRAGTLNQNNGRVHIEISGLFENHVPSQAQLRVVRRLIDFLLAPNNLLPSLNSHSQVTYHNAVPGQNTACPGWRYPLFGEWFRYLQGGAEPSWWNPAVSEPPAPPAPRPVPPQVPAQLPSTTIVVPSPELPPPPAPGTIVEPEPAPPVSNGQPSGVIPVTVVPPPADHALADFQSSFEPFPDGTREIHLKEDTVALDVSGVGAPKQVVAERPMLSSGTFLNDGRKYYRGTSGGWYGVPANDVVEEAPPPPEPAPAPRGFLADFFRDPIGALIRLIARLHS